MGRKRVAISQRVVDVPSYGEVRDCLDQEWSLWIESFGMLPVPVPNRTSDVADFCDSLEISAIFLSGGNNMSGAVYEDSSLQATGASKERDATEFALIDLAINQQLPLIAWCRGMQVLQVYFGGKLCQMPSNTIGHVACSHTVEITSDKHRSISPAPTVEVNSYHDFCVRRSALAAPLRELAVASDQTVEAVFHPTLPIIGCMWHPERPGGNDGFNRALVRDTLFRDSKP